MLTVLVRMQHGGRVRWMMRLLWGAVGELESWIRQARAWPANPLSSRFSNMTRSNACSRIVVAPAHRWSPIYGPIWSSFNLGILYIVSLRPGTSSCWDLPREVESRDSWRDIRPTVTPTYSMYMSRPGMLGQSRRKLSITWTRHGQRYMLFK
jgi:hypothetical protein